MIKYQRSVSLTSQRHPLSNKPPLPITVGLMVYMKTRNKSIVDQLAYKRLIVNYQRVKNIQKVICKRLCNLYDQDGIVCPPGLQSGIFTTSAIDNIDHNQSSNTAKTSFYGTSVTAFQHPDMPVEKQDFSFDFKTDSYDSGPSNCPRLTH